MRKFAILCTVCAILFSTALTAAAVGMSPEASGVSGNGGAMSEEIIPSEGAPFDSGNNARTGDIQSNGGANDGTAGGTANGSNTGDSGSDAAESGNTAGESQNSANRAMSAAENSTTAQTTDSGSGWFAAILAIVIVAAITALIVALIPRRNRT